ncbi:MAG: metallophosphoesterase [Eubacterium sp.]
MALYILILLIFVAAIGVYFYFRLKRLAKFYKIKIEKIPAKIIHIILTVVITFFSVNIFHISAIVLLHIIGISACLDILVFGVCKIRNSKVLKQKTASMSLTTVCGKIYECGIIPILISAVILGYGYLNMKNVVETNYVIETDKIQDDEYRVAIITDTHYGTIQDKEVLRKKCVEISKKNPDIVILGGDIVEEGTSKADMQEVFQLLGGIESRYGIYYVYGNHDRQPYTNNRTFSNEELERAIIENNIKILEDEYVNIGEDLILAGRGDAAWEKNSSRASVEKILEGADRSKYIIVADHQPLEAEENSSQGVDLEVSGHTHAGQIWPVGFINELMGTLNYGMYEEENCKVIVSSGFAGWRYPIRTGEHSEYVIVDIK